MQSAQNLIGKVLDVLWAKHGLLAEISLEQTHQRAFLNKLDNDARAAISQLKDFNQFNYVRMLCRTKAMLLEHTYFSDVTLCVAFTTSLIKL